MPWKPPICPENRSLPGIEIRRTKKHGLTLTTVTVLDEAGSRAIGKPPGRYITLETDPIGETALTGSEEAALLGESLGALLPSEGTLLVACLGNAAITPDARWGPGLPAGYWQPVMWQAGNSCSGNSVRWQCWRRESSGRPALRPPALSAPWQGRSALRRCLPSMPWLPRDLSRLGRTVQIADCGIAPGAGVGNDRAELSRHTLGIPVVSMGIPTVVDCRTLLHDLGLPAPAGVPQSMVVTPRDVDLLIDRGAPSHRHGGKRRRPARTHPRGDRLPHRLSRPQIQPPPVFRAAVLLCRWCMLCKYVLLRRVRFMQV